MTRVAVADQPRVGRRLRGGERRAARTSGATWLARWCRSGLGLLELRPLRMSLEEVFLQVTTEEDDRQGGAGGGGHGMSNILAIAQKEIRSYFASPIAYMVIGLFALLFGYFYVAILDWFVRQGMMGGMGMQAGAAERQPAVRAAAAAQRDGGAALRAADDHDAHVRRGEALGHDGAAADLAAHRPADHPRQVPRRDGALRRDARRHARSTSAVLFVFGNPEWKPIATAYLGLLLWAAASSRWAC